MKRNKIIISVILIVAILSIVLTNNKQYELSIETYIDGKLNAAMPSSGEGYIVKSLSCTNGVTAEFNYATWEIEASGMSSNTTCTIEFTKNLDGQKFNDYLLNKKCSSTTDTTNCLVEERGYRYQGATVNNYVSYNNEMWRIIGVFNIKTGEDVRQSLVKIIKDEPLDVLAYESASSASSTNWLKSSMKELLNNAYYNSKDVSCNAATLESDYRTPVVKTCNFSESGLNNIARNMIEEVVWNLGAYSVKTLDKTIDFIYRDERGNSVPTGFSDTWLGKIGLMYASDYGYSMPSSSCARTIYAEALGTQECAGSSWLYGGDYYTMTPILKDFSGFGRLLYVDDNGAIETVPSRHGMSTYPTLYLKDNVRYISGNGTYSNPFVIS